MRKCYFLIILLLLSLLVLSIINSGVTIQAAFNAVTLWALNVMPSLFPFFILSQMLLLLGFAQSLGKVLSPLMKWLRLPDKGAYAFAMSLLCGYPNGARICGELYERGEISADQCRPLSALCHSSGPLFVISTVASAFFKAPQLGMTLLILHFSAVFCNGSICSILLNRSYDRNLGISASSTSTDSLNELKPAAISDHKLHLGKIFGSAIETALKALLLICGYMVFFGILIDFLRFYHLLPQNVSGAVAAGVLEITNGLSLLSKASASPEAALPLACALLCFSGLSVIMQALAFLPKTVSPAFFIFTRITCAIIGFLFGFLYTKTHNLLFIVLLSLVPCLVLSLFRKLISTRPKTIGNLEFRVK